MLNRLFRTDGGYAALILRLTLAVVMFPHGAQKVLGWWGGHGFGATVDFFTGPLGLPAVVAVLVILGEFLGPIGLAVGLLARPAAAGLVVIMLGALQRHWSHGFFMNWFGQQTGEGFEYHLLVIGIGLAVVLQGAGAMSLDRKVAARLADRA